MMQFLREVRHFNPSLISAQFLDTNAFYLQHVRRLTNIPTVITLHGSDVKIFPDRSRFHFKLFKAALHAADRVIFTSEDLRTHMPGGIDLNPTKVRIVHNGINIDRVRQEMQAQKLQRGLFSSRLAAFNISRVLTTLSVPSQS